MQLNNLDDSFYKEKSTLDILDIVNWKKQNKKYNFTSLPKTAILTVQHNVISRKRSLFYKKTKGVTGKNYVIDTKLLLCTNFGIGAPAVISLMEELRILGVTQFFFIGLAGRIDHTIAEGEICIAKTVFSTTGCSALYASGTYFEPITNNWFTTIASKLNYKQIIGWSTDAPFRETQSLIEHYKAKGAKLVDMECAAIYAFAKFYNLNAFCVLIASDALSETNWSPPKDMNGLNDAMLKTFKTLSKIISNV
jgi:uridine phosphorylase